MFWSELTMGLENKKAPGPKIGDQELFSESQFNSLLFSLK
jgi:hypothetical protein